jgi:hypothetical protein
MDTILPAVPVIAFHVQIGNGSARTYALSPPPLRALLPRWKRTLSCWKNGQTGCLLRGGARIKKSSASVLYRE